MRYINEALIWETLEQAEKTTPAEIEKILQKSRKLQRLTLAETAALLTVDEPEILAHIFQAAAWVKNEIYGKRVVLFAPLYISNICQNTCRYCAFKADNKLIERKALTADEIQTQVEFMLQRGHKRILLVAGESQPRFADSLVDYYTSSIEAIYAAQTGAHKIKRVNINCAPLSVADFQKLKKAGIGTFQIFQETYHEETYKYVHVRGPKTDPDKRIAALDDAFAAGIDDVGMGVLYGLFDYRFDTLALLLHIEQLEKTWKVGPHTISVPRIEPAVGAEYSLNIPHKVSDLDFKKIVAVLRLSVPYTGMILSTRETARMRDELIDLGISQISAESSVAPGGYKEKADNPQFTVADHRSLDEIIASLVDKGYIPSFCAACYRMERTGEKFMCLAKPGTIKGKCSMNALITLREYLEDFAPENTKTAGYKFLEQLKAALPHQERQTYENFCLEIAGGARDKYV
ncbi:2-iminoacetate synthase [Candidatus Termititenax persephonae]|uniref:2-iminoacetate synthase n=2 Tax=Candidatus Termititenax persephonae TaxID=2218525 RepID=A0A388TK00_9BACT|nr:2-iminoacetate synthase [Candidatus Termititenax persephonae]